MSECMGSLTLSTKVDAGMRQFIEEEAEKRAVTPTELLRRILDLYRMSVRGELECAHCTQGIYLSQGVDR